MPSWFIVNIPKQMMLFDLVRVQVFAIKSEDRIQMNRLPSKTHPTIRVNLMVSPNRANLELLSQHFSLTNTAMMPNPKLYLYSSSFFKSTLKNLNANTINIHTPWTCCLLIIVMRSLDFYTHANLKRRSNALRVFVPPPLHALSKLCYPVTY